MRSNGEPFSATDFRELFGQYEEAMDELEEFTGESFIETI